MPVEPVKSTDTFPETVAFPEVVGLPEVPVTPGRVTFVVGLVVTGWVGLTEGFVTAG